MGTQSQTISSSTRTIILKYLTIALIVLDIFYVAGLIITNELEGYTILVVIALQIIALPVILVSFLLFMWSSNRDRNQQIHQQIGKDEAVSFFEKFKIAPNRLQLMIIAGILILLLSGGLLYASQQYQNHELEIISFNEDEYSGRVVHLSVENDIPVVLLEKYSTSSSTSEIVKFTIAPYIHQVIKEEVVYSVPENYGIHSITDAPNGYFILLQSVDFGGDGKLVRIYDDNNTPEDLTTIAGVNDIFRMKSFETGVHVFTSDIIDQSNTTVHTFFNNGTLVNYQFNEVIYDLITVDDTGYTIYRNQLQDLILDTYSNFATGYFNSTPSTNQLTPEFASEGDFVIGGEDANSITLFSVGTEVFYRSQSNLYSLTRDKWSKSPQTFDNYYTGDQLTGNTGDSDYIYLNSDTHISIYDRDTLSELEVLHSPGTDYSSYIQLPMVLAEGQLFSVSNQYELYIWSASIEDVQQANLLAKITLALIFPTLIIAIILLRKSHSQIMALGYQENVSGGEKFQN